MQLVHLPRSSIVYGTIENEIVFEKLRALPFYASFNEFTVEPPVSRDHQKCKTKVVANWRLLLTRGQDHNGS